MDLLIDNKKRYNLKNDTMFKEFFSKPGNEIFLKDFLESILKVEIKKIKVMKDISLRKEVENLKYGVLDISATLNDDTLVDVEIQVQPKPNIIKRGKYYASKIYGTQLLKGQDYNELKNVVNILILDYNIFVTKDYISKLVSVIDNYRDYVVDTGELIYVIELPKFRKSKVDMKEKLVQWLTFIDDKNKEGVVEAMSNNNILKKAKKEVDYLNGDAELIRIMELREKNEHDKAWIYGSGVQDGKNETKKEIAKLLLLKNISIEIISETTGLSINEIKRVNDELYVNTK